MFLPKPTEGGDFTPPPAGTFIATCFRFVDLGTQMSEYNGDKKTRHEVMLSWELSDELMEDGRPFIINKRYTWSTHEKATLRKHLEAWRGVPFNEQDFDENNANRFNIKNIIGKPCTLTISHTAAKDGSGKVFASVAGVGKMMKNSQAAPLVNSKTYLALTVEDFDAAAFGQLGDYYKQLITASPEYKEMTQKRQQPGDPGPEQRGGFDDDIPF